MELGRFLVAEAGLYVCQVLDKKVSRGTTYLVCNGGLHHHLSNSGNFGQVIRKNYPVAIANRMGQAQTEQVTVVGPLCTPLDIVADRMELPVWPRWGIGWRCFNPALMDPLPVHKIFLATRRSAKFYCKFKGSLSCADWSQL